jgi:hypothetical protein
VPVLIPDQPCTGSQNPNQIIVGAPLTFIIFFVGTVLPTMVLIYAILLPRYLRLTGSTISTVLLGGLTYAAMHIVEGWATFDSPRNTALSLMFVLFRYFGPGMIKSVLTLRTGNAWVHAVSYHAVAPHVLIDTPRESLRYRLSNLAFCLRSRRVLRVPRDAETATRNRPGGRDRR